MSGSNNCVPIFVIEGPMKDNHKRRVRKKNNNPSSVYFICALFLPYFLYCILSEISCSFVVKAIIALLFICIENYLVSQGIKKYKKEKSARRLASDVAKEKSSDDSTNTSLVNS